MSRKDELWKRIVQLYLHVKRISLMADEFSESSTKFIQPIIEERAAFDHIMRAHAVLSEPDAQKDADEYAVVEFESAIGHLHRAFFDAADWLNIEVRDRIITSLGGYTPSFIQDAIPAYHLFGTSRRRPISSRSGGRDTPVCLNCHSPSVRHRRTRVSVPPKNLPK